MRLAHARAVGSLSAGGAGPPLLFDARHVTASAGVLRVGSPGGAWTTGVPFDAVAIDRVAVAPEASTDLVLDVGGAATGRARLVGRAVFHNIFPGPRGQPPPGPAGLAIDARWSAFGGALARLQAGWRPNGAWMSRLDGDMAVGIHGPFVALAGSLRVDGGGTHLDASVARGRADLKLTLAGVDTSWMLDPALRPLFGGRLHGRFAAHAKLAPTMPAIDAEIVGADLRLDRHHAPSGPSHFELRIGGAPPTPGSADTLRAVIGEARLADAALRLGDVRLDWTGLRARADARVVFPTSTSAGAPVAGRSRVEARGALTVAALEDWIPGGAVTGPLRLQASARGTLERVDLAVAFPRPGVVDVLRQRFALPRRLDVALVAGVGLAVPATRVAHIGGGVASFGGRVGAAGAVDVELTLADYPLADLPGLDRAPLPPQLARPRGVLGADFTLTGSLARPRLDGQLRVTALGFEGRAVGDAAAQLRLTPDHGDVDVEINPGVSLRAQIRRRPRPIVDAKLTLAGFALGRWLPAPLAGAPLALSGDARATITAGATMTGDGAFALVGPGLHDVRLDVQARDAGVRAGLRGHVDIERWPALWPRWLLAAAGTIGVDVALAPRAAPVPVAVTGHVQIDRDVVVRAARLPLLPVTLRAGGRIDVADGAVSTPGVELAALGVRGRVTGRADIAADDIARSRVALAIAADVDAATWAWALPAISWARGKLTVAADVRGPIAAPGPTVDGRVAIEDVIVQPAGSTLPAVRARGVVDAHDGALTSDGLVLDVAGVGALTLGRPGAPARLQIDGLAPPRLGRVDVPLSARHLRITGAGSPLAIGDLDVDVRLTGDASGALRLAGDVAVADATLAPTRKPARPKGAGRTPWYRAIPPRLTLDVTLHGSRRAVTVDVPVLPDVGVEFQCRLLASHTGATLTGRLRGDGVYGRAAVAVYDWLTPGDLRGCQLGAP